MEINKGELDRHITGNYGEDQFDADDEKDEHIIELESEIAELRKDYMELIYAVATKYPNETRHETALRYIQEYESGSDEPADMPKEAADAKT